MPKFYRLAIMKGANMKPLWWVIFRWFLLYTGGICIVTAAMGIVYSKFPWPGFLVLAFGFWWIPMIIVSLQEAKKRPEYLRWTVKIVPPLVLQCLPTLAAAITINLILRWWVIGRMVH